MKIGTRFPVLGNGYIELVAYMGDDSNVVKAARQSTGKGFIGWEAYQRCDECEVINWGPAQLPDSLKQNCQKHKMIPYPNGDMGLLDKLYRSGHTSPFEMGGEIIIEAYVPIMVVREWFRHRTWSFNEFSARYAQMPCDHYLPEVTRIQKQAQLNKQGSGDPYDEEFAEHVITVMGEQQIEIYETYDAWCSAGMAKEIARLNTPVSRMTKFWGKVDLLNLLKFINLRVRPGAQYEIRQCAEILGYKIVKEIWPRTWKLFEEYDLFCARFGKTELHILQAMMEHFSQNQTSVEGFVKTLELPGFSAVKKAEFVEKFVYANQRIIG